MWCFTALVNVSFLVSQWNTSWYLSMKDLIAASSSEFICDVLIFWKSNSALFVDKVFRLASRIVLPNSCRGNASTGDSRILVSFSVSFTRVHIAVLSLTEITPSGM
uniref:Secreted protein n=1 Tax=Cacopsylla melanoneura TaxID=428564 RepID=A0A8D9A793_9HEMI